MPALLGTVVTVSTKAAPPTRRPAHPDTLVLSGGGIKGVAMMGAVHRLRAAGMLRQVRTVVGTSAGAIVGALVATKKDLRRALDIMCNHGYAPDFDFTKLSTQFGLDSGKCIDSLVGSLLDEGLTFRQVKEQYDTQLVVCVTNITRRQAMYLGPDTHPDMPVALAIRMSCSVPLYFAAVEYEGEWFVDGSIVDNFPCEWAADHSDGNVLGVSTRPRATLIKSFEAFVAAVVESAASSQSCSRAHILDLDVSSVSALNFGASRSEFVRLFSSGVEQADAFVKKAL